MISEPKVEARVQVAGDPRMAGWQKMQPSAALTAGPHLLFRAMRG